MSRNESESGSVMRKSAREEKRQIEPLADCSMAKKMLAEARSEAK